MRQGVAHRKAQNKILSLLQNCSPTLADARAGVVIQTRPFRLTPYLSDQTRLSNSYDFADIIRAWPPH